jgi:hypothetical protein
MSTTSRRRFIAGIGAGAGAALLGLTGRLRADTPAQAATPRRIVIVMQNNGTQQGSFWPRPGFAASPILEPILSVPSLARKTTVVRGLYLPGDTNGTDGNEHDIGFARLFTGEKLLSVGGHPWGGGPSVDQIIAKAWGVDSLTLAVLTSAVEAHPKPGFQHRRSFSYVAPATHKLPTLNPFDAYARLFPSLGPNDASGPDAKTRLRLRKSALDAANASITDMQNGLGVIDRGKLEMHLTAIREVEASMSRVLDGTVCKTPPARPRDYRDHPELLVRDESSIVDIIDSMVDLTAASIGCGLTRVATVQLGYGGGKWRFASEGIDTNFHDELAHKDTSDDGSTAENTAKVVTVNRFYARIVARLAQKLDALPDANGTTALDHTLIVWGNEFGRGDHSLENVPLVLIGGQSAGAPAGGRLVDRGRQPFQRIGCSLLRTMGIGAAGFGDAPDCGPIVGL